MAALLLAFSILGAEQDPIEAGNLAEPGSLLENLRASHGEWLRIVEFRSTYWQREGQAESLETTFAADPFVSVTLSSPGVFHRTGDLRRMSIDHAHATRVVGVVDRQGRERPPPVDSEGNIRLEKGEKLFVSRSSFDELSNAEFWLTYSPRWKNVGDVAVFAPRADSPMRVTLGGCTTAERRISPLNPLLGCHPDPFGGEAVLSGSLRPTYRIIAAKQGYLDVIIESQAKIDGQDYRQTQTSTWWMEPPFPVITRMHRLIFVGNNRKFLQREARLSGFQKCPGGYVARRVVFANEDVATGRAFLTEWVSEDLGAVPPTDEDFVITIPPTTRVDGLKNPPPPGRLRRLTLSDIGLEDLLETNQGVDPVSLKPRAASQHEAAASGFGLVFWINLALIVIGVTFAGVWEMRRRRQRTGSKQVQA